MKKAIVWCVVAVLLLAGLITSCCDLYNSCEETVTEQPEILQKAVSPDGEYVAYVFESNKGATTRFTYRLSVLKKGEELKAGDVGNTFRTYHKFDVLWVDENTLKVNSTDSKDIFEEKTEIYDVHIEYAHMKK